MEYIYEFGLTDQDKEKLREIGTHALSLNDYANAMDAAEQAEEDIFKGIINETD